MASSFIQRTFTAGDREKFTISVWLKRSVLTLGYPTIFQGRDGSDSYASDLKFRNDDSLELASWNSSSYDGGRLVTHRRFRDTSAWYHIVGIVDTANVTSGDRVQLWVNGVRETSFSTETYPASAVDWFINKSGATNSIGTHASETGNNSFDGLMSHMHFYDGYAYTASDFGEFDATSGIWKIKTSSPSATYGTNGFFMKFEDSSNMDLDSSSNALTFTTTGDLTATKDNPSNNFATLNPVQNFFQGATFSKGNNTIVTGSAIVAPSFSTLGVNAGKWYWEVKPTTRSSGNDYIIGVSSTQTTAAANELGTSANDWGYYSSAGQYRNNNTTTVWGDGYDTDDIIGIALDVTNLKLYFSKNGTWQNSGDPTSGATGTGAISITLGALGNWFAGVSYWAGAGTATFNTNFGNGYFGTTAVSSAQADDAGIGAMEYDVPADYYCLCTKNIKAYG